MITTTKTSSTTTTRITTHAVEIESWGGSGTGTNGFILLPISKLVRDPLVSVITIDISTLCAGKAVAVVKDWVDCTLRLGLRLNRRMEEVQ